MNPVTYTTTLSFQGVSIRAFEASHEPWFNLSDIYNALEIRAGTKRGPRFAEDLQFKIRKHDFPEAFSVSKGNPDVILINQIAVHQLAVRSTKEISDEFHAWFVYHALPTCHSASKGTDGPEVPAQEMAGGSSSSFFFFCGGSMPA